MIDHDREPWADTGRLRFLAERALESAAAGESRLAEVYLKDARSLRCEIGPLAIRSIAHRMERGIAIRMWDAQGREGFAHADAPEGRRLPDLTARARPSGRTHPGGLTPRLPSGRMADASSLMPARPVADPGSGGGSEEEAVKDLAGRLIAACSAPGGEATGLSHGWIETGRTLITIVNSAGLRVSRKARGATVGLTLGSSGVGSGGARGVRALRYTVAVPRLSEIDPVHLVREASWRAASAIGGSPVSGRNVLVALDPRSAAVWIRSLIAGFTCAAGGETPGRSLPFLGALTILDDPALGVAQERPPIDGEGRSVGPRTLLKDGVRCGRILDSRHPGVDEEALGPMRRDSFRDVPEPGPIHLSVPAGERSRDEILRSMHEGLYVTSLVPLSAAGSASFIARACGIWIEGGHAHHPVARTILMLPAAGSPWRIVASGSDLESDPAGPPVTAPTLVLQGATLLPM